MMAHSPTAILLFSRTPVAEAAAKQLTGKTLADVSLFSYLYHHAHTVAVKSGFPVIFYDEQRQQGSCFGEKITHALKEIFEKGYENIIVIGNDCLQLSHYHIRNVQKEMEAGKQVVAGPDKRGGLYLFGINKSAFSIDAFLSFSWQSKRLWQEFKNYSKDFSSSFINSKTDINEPGDLIKSYQFYSVGPAWLKLLRIIIRLNLTVWALINDHYYFTYCTNNIPLRAPPPCNAGKVLL